MMRPRRISNCILSAAITLVLCATGTGAQDVPTAFVHGLASSGGTWQVAADRLRNEFQIATYLPNLNWRNAFGSQAAELSAALPAGASIAVGHSNGSIVAREWNRQYSANNRIVSVGALHQGAPLAASVLNGTSWYYAGSLFYGVGNAFNYYAWYWRATHSDNAFLYYALGAVRGMAYWGRYLPSALGTVGFTAGAEAVLNDMRPGSSFFATLNSSANLARESQAMVARVGISAEFPTPINAQFYGLLPDYARQLAGLRALGWAWSVAAYYYYQYWIDWNHPYYYELHGGASLWAISAVRIMDIDAAWCHQIGTLGSYTRYGIVGYNLGCYASDAIVPVSSQQYPGFTAQRHVVGPSHQRETRDSRVLAELEFTFSENFNVPRRTSGSPTLTGISIDGPTQIRSGATCTWNAVTGSGSPPYTYQWTNDGMLVGNDYSYTGSRLSGSTSSSFRVRLVVTDAANAQGEHEITVSENSSAPVCFI